MISLTTRPAIDAQHDLHGIARDADEPIDLGLGDDERRREVDRVARGGVRARRRPRARDDPALHHLGLDALGDLLVAGEVLLGRAVFHELDRGQQPLAAADVARVRMITECLLQPLVKARAHFRRVLD